MHPPPPSSIHLIPNSDLDFWNFDPKIHYWVNLGPKSQSCSFYLKIGTHGISGMLILIPTLVFWISNPKFFFGQIWIKKSLSCSFFLKIGTHGISRMLILIPTLVLWISKPKFIFGQIWPGKVKAAHFAWKLTHRVARGFCFLFQD